MSEELSPGPGTAVLVIPMPGGMEAPTDTVAAMIAWLFRHGRPRTGEVLTRLERHGWTLELPYPGAVAQTAVGLRSLPEHRAGASLTRPFQGRVSDLMRWTPADRPADATRLAAAEPSGADQ